MSHVMLIEALNTGGFRSRTILCRSKLPRGDVSQRFVRVNEMQSGTDMFCRKQQEVANFPQSNIVNLP